MNSYTSRYNTAQKIILFSLIALQSTTLWCMNNHSKDITVQKNLSNNQRRMIINKHLQKASSYTSGLSQFTAYCDPAFRNQLAKTNKLWNGITSKKNKQLYKYMPAHLIAPKDQIYLLRYFSSNREDNGATQVINNLLKNGVKPDLKIANDILTLSPLECAYLTNNNTIAIKLFNAYASSNKNIIYACYKNKNEETKRYEQAMLAVYTDNKDALKKDAQWRDSLQKGTTCTKNAVPAFCVAAYLGHKKMLKFLFRKNKYNINPTLTEENSIDLILTKEINTLYNTAQKDHALACKLISPLLYDNIYAKKRYGNTVLHFVALDGNAYIASILLHNIKQIEKKEFIINAENNRQWTPLFIATEQQHFPVIQQLVDAGADIHHKDKWQQNVLHILVENEPNKNTENIAQYFINKGVDINQKNKEDNTPLQLAQKKNNQPMIDMLNRNLLPKSDSQ